MSKKHSSSANYYWLVRHDASLYAHEIHVQIFLMFFVHYIYIDYHLYVGKKLSIWSSFIDLFLECNALSKIK